jgi:hypothetical protein
LKNADTEIGDAFMEVKAIGETKHSQGVRRVAKKKTYVCGLCLEPFLLDVGKNSCISLCKKCWDIGDVQSA